MTFCMTDTGSGVLHVHVQYAQLWGGQEESADAVGGPDGRMRNHQQHPPAAHLRSHPRRNGILRLYRQQTPRCLHQLPKIHRITAGQLTQRYSFSFIISLSSNNRTIQIKLFKKS